MFCLSQQLYITNSERYPDFKKISFDENRINVQKPKFICWMTISSYPSHEHFIEILDKRPSDNKMGCPLRKKLLINKRKKKRERKKQLCNKQSIPGKHYRWTLLSRDYAGLKVFLNRNEFFSFLLVCVSVFYYCHSV